MNPCKDYLCAILSDSAGIEQPFDLRPGVKTTTNERDS